MKRIQSARWAAAVALATSGLALSGTTIAAAEEKTMTMAADTVEHLGSFAVVELRRYTITPNRREDFARYFESYFPEAFEQLGAIAFGDFLERARGDHFTWLRGFHDLDARARINGEFYYGPLWKEHKATLNSLLVDSDDVLLLRPLRPETGIPVLPAVDVVRERAGARGVVVAQIFRIEAPAMNAFLARAEPIFETYRQAGARQAGGLVTLDVPNNFPQLPVRTDGPYVVWLGIFPDDVARERAFAPAAAAFASALASTDWLKAEPEVIILDPGSRSRLRWR